MKKMFTLLLLMVSTQLYSQKKVAFGFKGGLNFSTLTHLDRGGVRSALHAGALLHWRMNGKWRLQPELYFSMQGKSSAKSEPEESYHYIALPILVQYRFTDRFFATAGPQLAALVNPKRRDYPDLNGEGFTNRHEQIGDFLIAAGAGYEFNPHLGVYLRYNQGLVSIRRSANAPEQRNVVGQAGVYVKL